MTSPRTRSRQAAHFRRDAPPERLAVVRIAVFGFGAAYIAARASTIVDVDQLPRDRFAPVGAVGWLDAPFSGVTLTLLVAATVLAAAAAAAGWRFRISGPLAAAGLAVVLSHRLSWGQVLHTENLLVLHAIVLAASPAADAWAFRRPLAKPHPSEPQPVKPDTRQDSDYSLALLFLAAITASSYVIAAWAKIRNGGIDWATGDVLRSHIAHDNLRKELLGDPSSPFASTVVPLGALFPPMAWAAMLVELGAVAAVVFGGATRLSNHIRRLWIVAVMGFHVAVLALMAIAFPYQLLGIAFLPLVDGERLVDATRRRLQRWNLRPVSSL